MKALQRGLLFLFVAVLFLTGSAAVLAQMSTASLFGDVTDPQGAVVAGAKITLTQVSTNVARTTESDATGRYQFLALPPGKYSLRVERDGFKAVVGKEMELSVNTSTKLNFALELGTLSETVTVVEGASGLNTTDASLGKVITSSQVMNLPLEGRSPTQLLVLQAGVAFSGDPTDNRSGSVNGARSDQINVTLDGVDINDQQKVPAGSSSNSTAFGTALPVPLESIQEFRFTTSNAGADQGRSSSGQVALVTKSGTNEYHGSLFWTHRNTATTANDLFNKNAQAANGQPNKPPKLLRNQFGGSVGGPVLKDRFFFFGTYEGSRRREEATQVQIVPTDTLRNGSLRYRSSTGALVTLTPAQIQQIDPAGIGVNPNMLTLLQGYPTCNDFTQGLDADPTVAGGLNFCGFRFNAPIALVNNVAVAKFDYHITRDARHTLSWRGTYGDLVSDQTPQQFPGQPVAQQLIDNSKGFSAAYSAQLSNSLSSIFRWGYSRLSRETTGPGGDALTIRSFTNFQSFAVPALRQIPTHNFTEDLTWVRGSHTFQFGANLRTTKNHQGTFANSFATYAINDGFCAGLCNSIFTNVTGAGLPAVATSSRNPFKRSVMALYGMFTQIGSAFVFDGTNNVLASGAPVDRNFKANEEEFYVQDTWRWTRNLTVTLGVRYGHYGVPWETNGFQTGTTVPVQQWFNARALAQQGGLPSASVAPLSWDLIGPANGKSSYYNSDLNNFAPNLSFAYSPGFSDGILAKIFGGPGKSSIRGGYRTVYDRVGGSFIVSQDINGAVGLVTPVQNTTGVLTYSGANAAPRFAGFNSLPSVANFVTAPSSGFPATPASTIGNRGLLIDDGLRTPYAHTLQLSYGRELPWNTSMEIGYVGRLGHKLLIQADVAAPLIYLRDPVSGTTYAQAVNQLYTQSQQGTLPTASITPIPYFDNLFSQISTTCGTNAALTPTQAVYGIAGGAFPSFTDSLIGIEGCADLAFPTFFQQQFDSLPAWTNMGYSNYHGMQLTFRKRQSHGLQFDVNYTWSKSNDNGSSVENTTRLGAQVADIFNPANSYGVSNFDLRHQFSSNWVYQLPFGRGQRFGGGASGWVDQVIGGWQTSGIIVWRSAFPLTLSNGFNFPTNFFLTPPGTATCPINTSILKSATGGPNLFGDTATQNAAFACVGFTPSGSSGARGILRGSNFINVDFGLRKHFPMPWEGQRFVFDWQVFNLANHANLDDRTVALNPESRGTFGRYTATIGGDSRANNGRVMQFSLRWEF